MECASAGGVGEAAPGKWGYFVGAKRLLSLMALNVTSAVLIHLTVDWHSEERKARAHFEPCLVFEVI
jgi:hypothetical protein